MTKDEALKLALENIKNHLAHHEHGCVYLDDAITAICNALAEQPAQQQEPACKRCNSYATLVKSLDAQISIHKRQADKYREAIASLESERAANAILTKELEQIDPSPQQQEPVAVVSGYYGGQCVITPTNPARLFNPGTALYTSPPQRKPWVGLTDEEIARWFGAATEGNLIAFARAIEAAHGIKE